MSKFYRVVTFQSKEVVDILLQNELYLADINKAREGSICQEDIDACCGNTPIWVFQHPAFCFDTIGDEQFCNMLETFRCEMSIPSLNDLYMIELHLNYQPPIGKAHNGCSLACIIPSIKLNDVAGIYKLNQTEFFFYDIIPYKLYSSNCLFSGIYRFNKDDYKNDKLPTLKLIKFLNEKEYYDYEKVRYVYVLSIVGNKRLDLFIDDIINMLPNHELGLVELYDEVTKIINTKQEKVTDYQKLVRDCATKCSPKRSYTTPQSDAFSYDSSTEMLTIAGKKNSKVRMRPKDVVAFMNNISAIKSNIWSPSCDDIKNTADALRSKLIKENYKKLDGPINCEVWGVFNDDIENLLMLEIIYPYTGSRHINVALDLSKF